MAAKGNMEKDEAELEGLSKPQNVKVMKDPNRPATGIVMTWEAPILIPDDFKCYLCYIRTHGDKGKFVECGMRTTINTSMTFHHLKTNTVYYGCVAAIYGHHGEIVISSPITTDKDIKCSTNNPVCYGRLHTWEIKIKTPLGAKHKHQCGSSPTRTTS